ncbi:MAG: 50S ribosomal protein L11 methyltransferase [Solirubrobacteraceae bacterium]
MHRRHAELVLAELLELAPSGVEEVEIGSDVIEYAVYGAPGELPALPALEAAARGAYVDVSTQEIADDWADRWRSFHRPLVIADRLTVRPPWEPPGATGLDIVIDPGQAFGTGAHATTRLCLELMLDAVPGGSFVDIGCGSGVLAITAAKLGWDPVTALDHDPAAVTATRENAARNRASITVEDFDLRSDPLPDTDVAVANILAGPLIAWAAAAVKLPPRLILSGVLSAETERVVAAFGQRRRRVHARRVAGEWTALALSA